MKQTALLAFSLFALLSCGDIFDSSDDDIPRPSVAENDPAIVPVPRTPSASVDWWYARHNGKVDAINNNKYGLVFIGDSVTRQFETTGKAYWDMLDSEYKALNLGFSGDKTQHVLWRIENGEFPEGLKPSRVVILIGTNNSTDSPESVAAGIAERIKTVHGRSPLAKIILLSILPRGIDSSDKRTIKNNKVNDILAGYNGHLNVVYLDIGRLFKDEGGTPIAELYNQEDNLHLVEEGYRVWYIAMRHFLTDAIVAEAWYGLG